MNRKIALTLLATFLAACSQSPTDPVAQGSAPAAAPTTTPTATAGGKIEWLTNFDQALSKAKESKKPVLVDFYADWCGPCKMMDKQTYVDGAVIAEMADWINVKVDVDQHQELSKRYDISAIPTTVLLSSDGKTLKTKTGFIDAKEYVSFLKSGRPTQ